MSYRHQLSWSCQGEIGSTTPSRSWQADLSWTCLSWAALCQLVVPKVQGANRDEISCDTVLCKIEEAGHASHAETAMAECLASLVSIVTGTQPRNWRRVQAASGTCLVARWCKASWSFPASSSSCACAAQTGLGHALACDWLVGPSCTQA